MLKESKSLKNHKELLEKVLNAKIKNKWKQKSEPHFMSSDINFSITQSQSDVMSTDRTSDHQVFYPSN